MVEAAAPVVEAAAPVVEADGTRSPGGGCRGTRGRTRRHRQCHRGTRRRRPSTGAAAVTEALARLADLRDSGAITEADFEAKKQELLDRL